MCAPFALQADESTDVSNCAQLIVFVRYVHKEELKDEFLCCVDLQSTTRGGDVYNTIDAFLRLMISNGSYYADFALTELQPC